MKIGIIGASGLIGHELLNILSDQPFPITELRLMASDNSVGKEIVFNNQVIKLLPSIVDSTIGLDLVFTAISNDLAEQIVPPMLANGVSVIDKSSTFRLNQNVPLMVAGVNDSDLHEVNYQPTEGKLIANPNCSSIQFTLALNPVYKNFGLKYVFVSTYQSISGAGRDAVNRFFDQIKFKVDGEEQTTIEQAQTCFASNVIPSIGSRNSNGQNSEETKLVLETKKILHDNDFPVLVHACRVAVAVGHCEAITVMLKEATTLKEMEKAFSNAPYVKYCNNIEGNDPTALACILAGEDDVLVGRLRPETEYRSQDDPNKYFSFSFFCAANNLRIGAALNAVRIAKMLHNKEYLSLES